VLTLAINTSANFVSLALLREGNIIELRDSRKDYIHSTDSPGGTNAGENDQLPPGYTQKRSKKGQGRAQAAKRVFPPGASVMLAPLIKQILDHQQLSVHELDLICLAIGPGSFTGLRVGVVTAKSLAYAGDVPIVAVNNLAATAAQTFAGLDAPVACRVARVGLNAQRQQLFAGTFQSKGEWQVERLGQDQIQTRNDFVESFTEGQIATGTGIKPVVEAIAAHDPSIVVAAQESWELSAVSIAQFGIKSYQAGQRDDFWKIEPLYFRPSAAEEMRLARNVDLLK
jgi:tRNA threonylcarbamoyladenosine biosynthesis protein TsaB